MYIERKREWQSMFAVGKRIGKTLQITEDDVMEEIKEYRVQSTEYLITGDKDLLVLEHYENTTILNPKEYLVSCQY